MILLVVTIVLVMISLAGFGFVALMYTENKAAHLHGDEMQVQSAAASGVELLKAMLTADRQARTDAGGIYDNPELFQGALVYQVPATTATVRFTLLSPRIENGAIAGIRYGAANESTRLNLSVLANWDRKVPGSGRNALMQLPNMTDAVADAILDWLDSDAAPRGQGAEADYYSGLESPYAPRNGALESLEELLLVRDVPRAALFGADFNQNFQIDPEETATGDFGTTSMDDQLPWAAYLTLYSAERNARPDGTPRIDLNHAELQTLYQLLTGAVPDTWRRFIIAYRQFGPTNSSSESEPPGTTVPLDLNKPAKYKIGSLLDLVGAKVAIPSPSGSSTRVYESPLRDAPESMLQDLPKLLDVATVDQQLILKGRVNVNHAPREVLAAVPGMTDTIVEQIIAGRGLQGVGDEEDPAHRYPIWLLSQGLVDRPTMRTLLPYLTCGGEVYRAQVVGFFDTGSPSARVEVVIDATGQFPRQVYWRDLRLLGRGFSLETLRGELPEDPPTPLTAQPSEAD